MSESLSVVKNYYNQMMHIQKIHCLFIHSFYFITGMTERKPIDNILWRVVLKALQNKKAQLSLTNPRDACEKFARFT